MSIVNGLFLKNIVYITALTPCFQAETPSPIIELGWDLKLLRHAPVQRLLKKSEYKSQISWKLFCLSYNRCLTGTIFHRSGECHSLIHIRGEIFNNKIYEILAMLHRDVNPGFLMLD